MPKWGNSKCVSQNLIWHDWSPTHPISLLAGSLSRWRGPIPEYLLTAYINLGEDPMTPKFQELLQTSKLPLLPEPWTFCLIPQSKNPDLF